MLSAQQPDSDSGARYGSDTRYTVGPQYSASMGSVTVEDKQLFRLSLRPDIPIGKWGIAFDIELFIDDGGDFSDKGWAFGSTSETLDTFLRKIYYVRYGKPRDRLFVRIGALDRVTLGYGLIMDRYRNTLQYPGIKKTGVQFQMNESALGGVSIEGVVNNLQDIEQGGAVLGARASKKMSGKLEIGLTFVIDFDQYSGLFDRDGDGFPDLVDAFPDNGNLALDNDGDSIPDELDDDDDNDGVLDIDRDDQCRRQNKRCTDSGLPDGVIAVLDSLHQTNPDSFRVDATVNRKHPFNKDRVGHGRFAIVGIDAGYPILEKSHFDLLLYGQIAAFLDDNDTLSVEDAEEQGVVAGDRKAEGFGIMAPGLWLKTGPFDGRVEYRYFRDDFDAGYFDNLYELDRARLDVATGRASSKDAQLLRGESVSGIYGRVQTDFYGMVEAYADYQHLSGTHKPKRQLHAAASISPTLLQAIPRLAHAEAFYQKNNIGSRLDKNGGVGSQDGFFESTEDTFYGYQLGAQMSGGISVVWQTRFLFERSADGTLEQSKVMSIETVFDF